MDLESMIWLILWDDSSPMKSAENGVNFILESVGN